MEKKKGRTVETEPAADPGEMRTEKPKHSIRHQLVMIFVGMILFTLVAIGVVNHFFLGDFYTAYKQHQLMETYRLVNETDLQEAESEAADAEDSGSSDADPDTSGSGLEIESFPDSIRQVSIQNNIHILVADSDLTAIRSTGRETVEEAARLFGYFSGFYKAQMTIIKKTDTYTIQRTNDARIDTDYLEMWGKLDSGDWFLLRTPLEGISTTAHLANLFFMLVGISVCVISSILIWFLSGKFTEPITELTKLSVKMANQEFDAKYTGTTDNEIGTLGQNFNRMSDELEKTISELKSANIALQKDVEQKTQIDESRREFLNNVTHELKTPIALIQGYAEGLKDNVAEDEESRNFYCDVIIDESAKMNNMVKKLLTLNQLEFGNDQVQMDRFDLTQLIRGVIQGMQILIHEKNADVSFPVSGPVYVWGDEFKIEEVVTNYLSNALNHLDYDRKIEINVTEQDGIATTTVFNTGDPIPEEDLDRVFEKFFKVDKARTREYGGSGIGLSIVKAIMDGHHQKCGVKNYENGVAFWFTLECK